MKKYTRKICLIALSTMLLAPATSYSEVTEAQLDELRQKRQEVFGNGDSGDSGDSDSGSIFVDGKKKPGSICASDVKKRAQNFVNNLIPNVCGNINTNPDPSNSKYMYENPDGGCDIGLEMPGLPSFGGSISGINSCQIVKAVTGDMVDKVNDTVNGAWNGALDAAKNKIKSETGLDADNLNFDMGQIAEDAVTGN